MPSYVLPYDPLTVYGALGPKLTERVLEMAREYDEEEAAQFFTRQVVGRTIAGDPAVRLLLVLNEDGHLVGHAVATLERFGPKAWVFAWQCKVDGKQPGAVEGVIAHLREWGAQQGAVELEMATQRNEAAWQRSYGFTKKRSVLTLPFTDEEVTAGG